MIEEIVWTQGASADLHDIHNSLSEERALDLLYRIEASLSLLKKFPERAPAFKGTRLRRLLVGRKNRYGCFYSIVGNRIFIAALADLTMNQTLLEHQIRSRTGIDL